MHTTKVIKTRTIEFKMHALLHFQLVHEYLIEIDQSYIYVYLSLTDRAKIICGFFGECLGIQIQVQGI